MRKENGFKTIEYCIAASCITFFLSLISVSFIFNDVSLLFKTLEDEIMILKKETDLSWESINELRRNVISNEHRFRRQAVQDYSGYQASVLVSDFEKEGSGENPEEIEEPLIPTFKPSCACNFENRCSPGPPGPPGDQGADGEDGIDGIDGYDGFDALSSPPSKPSKAQFICPRGQPGDPGPEGPRGKRGLRGQRGRSGRPGLNGNTGYPGDIGSPGPNGIDGPVGIRGKNGEDGVKYLTRRGVKGAMGPPGFEGQPGVKGKPGLLGKPGIQGYEGMPGLRGIEGPAGGSGPEGPQGRHGEDAAYCECPNRFESVGTQPEIIVDVPLSS